MRTLFAMPALEVFGRRSRVVGSDDLYCPAMLLLLYQLPVVLLCALYSSVWRRCSSTTLDNSGLPFWYILGATPLLFFRGCIYFMIMHISAKGTIVDHERRMLMPKMLQVHTLWSVLLAVYGLVGLGCWYYRYMCHPDARFVMAVGSCLMVEVCFTFTLGICILSHVQPVTSLDDETTLDAYGNDAVDSERQSLLDETERAVPTSDVYIPHSQRIWKQRCTRCCLCLRCFTCNLFGGAGTHHDSMSVVAKVFSRLFYGSPDLVISDIVAGFVLLAAVQAHEEGHQVIATSPHGHDDDEADETLASLRKKLRFINNFSRQGTFTASHASKRSFTSQLSTLKDEKTTILDQSKDVSVEINASIAQLDAVSTPFYFHPTDPDLNDVELTQTLQELAHFSKYAIGIYGWMLYVWSHPWTGTFRLALACFRRRLRWVHGDNWFHLGQTALQLETKVQSDDIVYASFRNSVYQPAFAVLLDHERKEVILAIRGTLSLEDCLTDAIAYGMAMDDVAERWGCEGTGEYAHQGFLTCAESVYLELQRLGVLDMLFHEHSNVSSAKSSEVNACIPGAYHDYTLVLTGHSLGASTAVLLAILLRPKYPQLRCFAYSPSGCTVSPKLAADCAAFTSSVVVGDDIIARSSITSIEVLRDNVLDLIGRSKVNKAAILRQVLSWRDPDELLHHDSDEETTTNEEEEEDSTKTNETRRMRLPFIAQLTNYRTMLQRIQESEPIHELALPGRVVHLKRVVRAKNVAGCWVCCRPGGGGMCCTARTNYRFAWAVEGQFKQIRIGRTMLDDHFPDKVHYVLQDCVQRLQETQQHEQDESDSV